MLTLRDNTPNQLLGVSTLTLESLESIANRPLKDVCKDIKNLLVFPWGIEKCVDGIGDSNLFSFYKQRGNEEDVDLVKLRVSTGNVVGFVGVGDELISISSRFARVVEEDYFFHYMLEKVVSVNIVSLLHQSTKDKVFDFLMFLFPNALNKALRQGLFKMYMKYEHNDANVKGAIDVQRHISDNIPFTGKIAYNNRQHAYDNEINQLIRHTIEYIKTKPMGKRVLENDSITKANTMQIISATPSYSRNNRQQIINKCSRPISHPYYTEYAKLQKLCLSILRHEKLKYAQDDKAINGILFDISWLWEEYLNTLLKGVGFQHPDNRKGTGGIYLAKNGGMIRYPDFYNKSSDIVADAKYKRNVDRNDENQMTTYLYRTKALHGVFVNPSENLGGVEKTYDMLGYGEDNNNKIEIVSLHIPHDANDYGDFRSQMQQSEMSLISYFDSIMKRIRDL